MKKTLAVVAAAAALSLAFAPAAMAGEEGDHHYYGFHQTNGSLLSVLNGNNVNATVGACGNNVGVLGAAVPINSPSFTGTCAAGGIVDGDDVNVDG
ncbi:hypothetical protein SAMN05216553_111172 [Lentzea fradiae]|uniref:Small secreted domain n=1 Tax=Lentzea fradiae TaxID=200378 RepID=A0A1G7WZV2_9PSEU|nr:hypothetical protein SAMN05216553_111172 [Lentzea fradiae]